MTNSALTPFTEQLFGADIEGGGLTETVHAGKIILGSGITVTSFNEATKTATLSASVAEPAAHWRTILDVDFATQESQTFTGDGNVEIGNQTFVVENFANITPNVTHSMGIVNGQGLILPSGAAGSDMYPAWRGSPLFRWKFPTTVARGVPIRAACQIGASVTSNSYNASVLYLGIEYPSANARYMRVVGGTLRDSSADCVQICRNQVNNNVNTPGAVGTVTVADMIGVSCPEGVGPCCRYRAQSGLYASHYSDLGSMRQLADELGIRSTESVLVTDDISVASDWGVALAYCDAAYHTTYYASIRRLKVEAFY